MNILGYKLLLTVLVTFFYNLDRICAQNASQMLIPIIATNLLGPRKFERIIVPVYPSLPRPRDEDEEKPVSEKIIDIESTTEEIKAYHRRPKSNLNAGIGNNLKSYSYVTRTDGFHKKPEATKNVHGPSKFKDTKESTEEPEHKTTTGPNEIQPLHINPKVFKKTQPDQSEQTAADKKKKFKDQEERLKLKNLPENPKKVPETDWFDNHGKYNYGIVHHSQPVEEKASVEDTTENESIEIPKEAIAVIQHPPIIATTTSHPAVLKSNFKDPNTFSQVHQQNNNDGKFLYKSEVFYPTYRDHIYLPVTTYYGDPTVFPKQFPVFNAHTVYHTPHVQVHHGNDKNVQNVPIKVPLPIPNDQPTTVKTSHPPKKVHTLAVHKKEPPTQKHPLPSKRPAEKPSPPPPKKHQDDEYEDPEENDGGKSEYYDYEEGDTVEDDESGSNDKYHAESTEDYEEEEQEEKPTYRYESKNSFNARNDEKSSEDEFDRAWKKYGYGPKESSSSSQENESSESRIVPEIAPGRKKIVHMKMEYHTAPHDGIDVYESASNVENVEAKKPPREMNSKMSGTLNNSEDKKKKKKKNKKTSVKSQQQHPNAGPDDLKFFQDLFVEKNSPHEIEFGHVSETPKGWEERYERQNHSHDKNRHQGKRIYYGHMMMILSRDIFSAFIWLFQFFVLTRYFNYLGNGEHRAGGRVGNDKHYIEQHERGSEVAGAFQKKVKWADKDGGFGEHYWDLNHGK